MTTAPTPPIIRPATPLWVRILRTVLLGLLLAGIVSATLYIHAESLPTILEKMVDQEAESPLPESAVKPLTFIFDQVGYLAPFLAVLILQFLIHRTYDRHDGQVQREMMWEILIVAAVTYLVVLPYVIHISNAELHAALNAGEEFPKRAGGAYDTLILNLVEWFIRLAVGLSVLCLYHSVRAKREADDFVHGLVNDEPIAETAAVPAENIPSPSANES